MKKLLFGTLMGTVLLMIGSTWANAQILIQDQFSYNGTGSYHDGAPTIQGRTPDTVSSGATWLGSSGGIRLIGTGSTGVNTYGMGNYYENNGGAAIAIPTADQAAGTITLSFNLANLPSSNSGNQQYYGFSGATGLTNDSVSDLGTTFPSGSAWVDVANVGSNLLQLTLSDGTTGTFAASNAAGVFNSISLTYDLDAFSSNLSVSLNGVQELTGTGIDNANYAAYYSNYANQEQASNPTFVTDFTVTEGGIAAAPEPTTYAFMFLGAGVLLFYHRFSRSSARS